MSAQEKKEVREFKLKPVPGGLFFNMSLDTHDECVHVIEKSAFDSLKEEYERFRSTTYKLEADSKKAYDELLKDAHGLVDAIKNIPDAIRMEELARNWQSFDKKNRHAQHFYEGMLHMRSYILEALKAWEGREK